MFLDYSFCRVQADTFIGALNTLQKMLPAETGFATGDKWCIADMAVAPFLALWEMLLAHELGHYPPGDGKKTLAVLHGKQFARYNRYVVDLMAQPSFKANWDEVCLRPVSSYVD